MDVRVHIHETRTFEMVKVEPREKFPTIIMVVLHGILCIFIL